MLIPGPPRPRGPSLLPVLPLLSLLLLLLLPPSFAQTVPSVLLNSSVYWFPPNLTVLTPPSNLSTIPPTVISWPNFFHSQSLTLAPPPLNTSTPTTLPPTGPTLDRSFSPPSLVFNASAPLTLSVSSSTFFPSTVVLVLNLTSNCTYPACSLLSTGGKARPGSLILSTSPYPSPTIPTLYLLQLTVLTASSSITCLSSIPLPYNSWQVIALTTSSPSPSNASLLTLRTSLGSESFPLLIPFNDSIPYDPTLRTNLTVGDLTLRAALRDVALIQTATPLPLADLGDAIFTYLYALYGLAVPPSRVLAPNVTCFNSSYLLVQWAPPFSPTSPLTSYQIRVTATSASASASTTSSFIPTYNTLTSYQYSPARRDNSTSYSFAVYASNLDYPSPPLTTPLLYSPALSLITASASNFTPLSVPLGTTLPLFWFSSGNNITLFISFPSNTSTSGPMAATAPLQALSLFYSTDGGGNWTFVPFPLWNGPITWANLQGTATGLQYNNYYAFKTMASNVAGGVNSSASQPWFLQGGPGPASTAAALPVNGSGSTSSAAASPLAVSNVTGTSSSVDAQAMTGLVSAVTSGSSVSQLPAPPAQMTSSLSSIAGNATTRNASSSSVTSTKLSSAARASPSSTSAPSSNRWPSSSATGLAPLAAHSTTSSMTPTLSGSSAQSGPLPIDAKSSTSDTVIAGIIIGVFVGLLLLCILSYCCFCSSSARKKRQTPPTSHVASSAASPRNMHTPMPLQSPMSSSAEDKTLALSAGGAAAMGGPHDRRGPQFGGHRYGAYDADVELATVDAEWCEEEDALHQMREVDPPPVSTVHTYRR